MVDSYLICVTGFDYSDFVRAAVAAGRTENGVFGAKLMWGTLDEVVDKLTPAHPDLAGDDLALLREAFGDVRFVHLWRDDMVAQAVTARQPRQTDALNAEWIARYHAEHPA